jgi:hypothetical protein
MNSAAATPTSCIVLAPANFKELIGLLGSKKRIMHHFYGDPWKTRIWRNAEGKLMGTDPDHPEGRFILEMDANRVQDSKAATLKGAITLFLIKRGCSIDATSDVCCKLKPVFNRMEEQMAEIEDPDERAAVWLPKLLQLVELALDLIKKVEEGAEIDIVLH